MLELNRDRAIHVDGQRVGLYLYKLFPTARVSVRPTFCRGGCSTGVDPRKFEEDCQKKKCDGVQSRMSLGVSVRSRPTSYKMCEN
jgi:hypothetical protein